MRRGHYVEGLSGPQRLMGALSDAENRGAREANWIVVEGKPGSGKSGALTRLAIIKDGALVRAKEEWSPLWALTEIAIVLGLSKLRRTQDLHEQIVAELMQRPRLLIVDELNLVVSKRRVLQSLRDITDYSEGLLVVGGLNGTGGALKRFPEIYGRIARIATFGPASVADVKLLCTGLAEVPIADCMVARIQERTGGNIRLIRNSLGFVEAFGKKSRAPVTAESYGDRPLLSDDRHPGDER